MREDPGRENNVNVDTGVMTIILDGFNAPVTSGNFADLVDRGFYDGMEIQRSDGFVVQSGKPSAKGADGRAMLAHISFILHALIRFRAPTSLSVSPTQFPSLHAYRNSRHTRPMRPMRPMRPTRPTRPTRPRHPTRPKRPAPHAPPASVLTRGACEQLAAGKAPWESRRALKTSRRVHHIQLCNTLP